jgi:putative acetyltransferase
MTNECTSTMTYTILRDDLTSADVQALIDEHLAGMHQHSPPESVHALALDALRGPHVDFWTVWHGSSLCGCGALKELDRRTGEVKSMRTRSALLRRGVGQAMLSHILSAAHARHYDHLYLETGSGPAFEPAHQLYLRNGFEFCGPFGDYQADAFSVFMVRVLSRSQT